MNRLDDEDKAFTWGFFTGVVVASLITVPIGWMMVRDTTTIMRKQAVEHGAAEYDSTTGEWKWKQEVPDDK